MQVLPVAGPVVGAHIAWHLAHGGVCGMQGANMCEHMRHAAAVTNCDPSVLCPFEPGSWGYPGLYPSSSLPHSLVELPYCYCGCGTAAHKVQGSHGGTRYQRCNNGCKWVGVEQAHGGAYRASCIVPCACVSRAVAYCWRAPMLTGGAHPGGHRCLPVACAVLECIPDPAGCCHCMTQDGDGV